MRRVSKYVEITGLDNPHVISEFALAVGQRCETVTLLPWLRTLKVHTVAVLIRVAVTQAF